MSRWLLGGVLALVVLAGVGVVIWQTGDSTPEADPVIAVSRSNCGQGWTDPKILSAVVLWLVFVILLYLRYSLHVFGRQAALLTIVAFALLLFILVTPTHTFLLGGGP